MQADTNKEESRVMAIDYGEKRIGIALSDPLLTFAYPYKSLLNNNQLINELGKIIIEKKIEKILLGLPSDRFAASKLIADKVHIFRDKLIRKFKIDVLLWDEEFSSVLAKEKVIESVTSKKKRRDKSLIDSYSAAVILQEFLNSL